MSGWAVKEPLAAVGKWGLGTAGSLVALRRGVVRGDLDHAQSPALDDGADEPAYVQLGAPMTAASRPASQIEDLRNAIAGLRHIGTRPGGVLGQTHDEQAGEGGVKLAQALDGNEVLPGQLGIDESVEQLSLLAQQKGGAQDVALSAGVHGTQGGKQPMTHAPARVRIGL